MARSLQLWGLKHSGFRGYVIQQKKNAPVWGSAARDPGLPKADLIYACCADVIVNSDPPPLSFGSRPVWRIN